MAFEPFKVSVDEQGATTVARLFGELDLDATERFHEQIGPLIARARGGLLVLDLSGLTFMDSTGIRALLSIGAESRRDGFDLAAVGATGPVQRVLHLTGVDGILPIAKEPPPVS